MLSLAKLANDKIHAKNTLEEINMHILEGFAQKTFIDRNMPSKMAGDYGHGIGPGN